jgi:RHS repeat-associated protein
MTHRSITWSAPYTFSGKEKDTETGYGYFGARYYDSGLNIWLSVDPMRDKYDYVNGRKKNQTLDCEYIYENGKPTNKWKDQKGNGSETT